MLDHTPSAPRPDADERPAGAVVMAAPMRGRMLDAMAVLEAIALLAFLTGVGTLMVLWGAPRWLAVVCAAAGGAMATDLLLLARPRRASEFGQKDPAPPALVDRPPSASAASPAPSAPAASDDENPPATTAACTERLTLGYVRVARDNNDNELETQSEAIRGWCAENGTTLTTIVHDVEMQPGHAGTHPALDWALEQIAAGEAHTLVTTTLRHLSPSVSNLPPLLRWFTEPERTLVAIDLRLDTATEAGRLAAFALAGVGGWEHERLSARTRRGLEAARSRGRAAVADLPELRERIVHMRAQGLTLQAIADALNEEGVPTLRGGAKWRPSSVQRAAGYRRPAPQQQGVFPSVAESAGNGARPAGDGATRIDA
jgi:DNA invertase Pin-like site-specific DNA recombinase